MRRLAVIAPLILASAAQAGPGFWTVGFPPGSAGSMVFGVTWDGAIAVGSGGGGVDKPGFTWTSAGGRDDFGLEQGMPPYTPARGVNSDGSVVVGYTGFPDPFEPPYIKDQRAYRRIGSGSLENLGVLPNRTRSYAADVSGDGSIVVGTCESGKMSSAFGEAFYWTPQTGIKGLGYLKGGGSFSQAAGISADGSTIVGSSQSGGISGDTEAFTWTLVGGMKKLPELPGTPPDAWCRARAVNGDGNVVVGSGQAANGWNHPLRWVDGEVEDLVPGLPTHATAFAVDGSGDVVGGSYGDTAWVWTPGTGFIDFEDFLASFGIDVPADYRLTDINSISGDGMTFGGTAFDLVNKRQEGFVATIPTPWTIWIILTPCFSFRRRRG